MVHRHLNYVLPQVHGGRKVILPSGAELNLINVF